MKESGPQDGLIIIIVYHRRERFHTGSGGTHTHSPALTGVRSRRAARTHTDTAYYAQQSIAFYAIRIYKSRSSRRKNTTHAHGRSGGTTGTRTTTYYYAVLLPYAE